MVWITIGGMMLFGGMLLFALSGYDLVTEGGQTTLKRHGMVVKTWGSPPYVPPE
jgi:hypothetical protein